LQKAGWTGDDLALTEINEAFAAPQCAVSKDPCRGAGTINVTGGAIAIGHPVGASGCRMLVTLIHETICRDARRGPASPCIACGMHGAGAFERRAPSQG